MEKQLILGFDIGGTKCAVITALWDGENIELLKKDKCPTETAIAPEQMIEKLIQMADGILENQKPWADTQKDVPKEAVPLLRWFFATVCFLQDNTGLFHRRERQW